ncbi:MAG: ACT domain-containing protein [Elusimicrobiota bacterium]
MKVEVLKQFSVFMPNRPGALSMLARLFSDKGINLLGIASEVRDDSGVVRIAVAQDVDASAILSQGGFSSVETSLLAVDLDDKPGELFRVARMLADGKINITTVYGTAGRNGASRVLLAVENVQKALALLENRS